MTGCRVHPLQAQAISREMSKLSTVPTSWEYLSRVPALEDRNAAAIESRDQ
jgi:hypothetical protein